MSESFTWPCTLNPNWLLPFSGVDTNRTKRETSGNHWVNLIANAYSKPKNNDRLLINIISQQEANGNIPYQQEHKYSHIEQMSYPPVLAIALWQLVNATDLERHQERVKFIEIYQKVYKFHQYLYQNRDLASCGLIPVSLSEARLLGPFYGYRRRNLETLMTKQSNHNNKYIKDPFYHSLLCISNELLLKTGELLNQPLGDISCWHELTIHSMNECLWDEEQCLYQPIGDNGGHPLIPNMIGGFLPLVNGTATQTQAKKMCAKLRVVLEEKGETILRDNTQYAQVVEKRKFLEMGSWALIQWFLVSGLRNYGFDEEAKRLEIVTNRELRLMRAQLVPLEDGILATTEFQHLKKQFITKI